MSKKKQIKPKTDGKKNIEKKEQVKSSYAPLIEKWNELAVSIGKGLPSDAIFGAFSRASVGIENMPQLQRARTLGISALPENYTKEQIGEFLRNPYQNARQLRQTSQALKWTAYPYFKLAKTYADIPTYRHYVKPMYVTAEEAKSAEFMREAVLLDKLVKEFKPHVLAHEAVGKAVTLGKVAYIHRVKVDKSHNNVEYAFWQQLPTEYTTIIGRNNKSGWTVSFDLMYFLQPGTNPASFGDLFDDYLGTFESLFIPPKKVPRGVAYSSDNIKIRLGNKEYTIYPNRIKGYEQGNPRLFEQNGRWQYWVSLPVEKVFVFEIDDTTANVASPLSGLMLTYAQQSDYEAAQLSLILNPLIKIFTGEIEYFDENGSASEDVYKLSLGGRAMFEALFAEMMAKNNTAGTAFFTAPVKNIKSHDFMESANANEISESFNRYAAEKSGTSALIPASDDVKASQVEASTKIEGRYATATIYPQIEQMLNTIIKSLNLKHFWEFKMFGDIFNEAEIRDRATTDLDKGDISAFFILSALDGVSWLDKLSMIRTMAATGIMDELQIPQTAYTQSGKGGRPENEKLSDSSEHSKDAIGGVQ